MNNLIECDRSFLHFISDLINHRFATIKKQKATKRSHFLKIHFDNKGIEKVNIQSILHSVNDAIPSSFSDRSAPTVLFTRTPRIGTKIFNYKDVVKNLRPDTWCPDDHDCDCANSSFMDPHHGHIMTGNLNVVEHHKLRVLLSKGPTYREANKIDWNKVYACIETGVLKCVKNWCDKQKVDIRVLAEWKSRVLMEVKSKIKALKQSPYRPSPKKLWMTRK